MNQYKSFYIKALIGSSKNGIFTLADARKEFYKELGESKNWDGNIPVEVQKILAPVIWELIAIGAIAPVFRDSMSGFDFEQYQINSIDKLRELFNKYWLI